MDFIETTITEHIYNQRWIKGEIKGEVKGRKKTAVNLLNMGVDVKFISQATGFDEKEIKQLSAR
jgi:SOS response regulatory protein OraA/RecX